MAENFSRYPNHIFIAAAGIVVRAVSPHLTSKDRDPAVIVLDQEGKYVISLLSGHLGGANDLARKIAPLTGGEPVITTATDTAGIPSMDLLAKEKGLIIFNLEAVKSVNMALLMGETIQIYDPEDHLGLKTVNLAGCAVEQVLREGRWRRKTPGVWVTWKNERAETLPKRLILHPRSLVAGVGCNRGTGSREILDHITRTFRANGLALGSLKCLTTIEAKRDEEGLLTAARELGVRLFFFSPPEINAVHVPHPSDVVKNHMGVSSVCEATALLKSHGTRLLVPKTKSPNVTLAVALAG
ncbi:protein CbiG [delta proteobacterium NaphS2]|nr:protein CbiG [delta proteobacterium NaphS2]